jgi:hypothetical protein
MKNYVRDFFAFSINEAKYQKHHGKKYREYYTMNSLEDERAENYIRELKEEAFEGIKDQKIEGWYVDHYEFNENKTFMFVNDSVPDICVFLTPFFEFPLDTGINVEIFMYDPVDLWEIENVHYLLSGDMSKDVNVIVELVIGELKELISNNLKKLLKRIKENVGDIFELALKNESVDATIWLMTLGFSPEKYFDDEEEMFRFYQEGSEGYTPEQREILRNNLPIGVFSKINRNAKKKNLFGI